MTSPSSSGLEVLGAPARADADGGAGGRGQLQVAGEEVGVEVRVDDQLDGHALLPGHGEHLVDVPSGVDRDGPAGAPVADQVRGLGQAAQVELADDEGVGQLVEGERSAGAALRVPCAVLPRGYEGRYPGV